MKHGLLIAEKSSARKDIEAIYLKNRNNIPYQLDFEQFHGHVVSLKSPGEMREEWDKWDKSTLPMLPDEQEWSYVPEEDPKRYNAVKSAILSGKYDFIINAGDYEREGQLIQDAFFSTLDIKVPIYRLWGNDLTENEVVKGLNNLLAPTDTIPGMGSVENLSRASFIRARMDWLIGLNSTRALTLRGGTTIRSGRVKIPILKILADRELAIQNFEVKPFWTLRAHFKLDNGETYEGIYYNQDEGKNIQFLDKAEAEKIKVGTDGKVLSVTKKTAREKSPNLYSIGSLQGDAAEIFGVPMEDSLSALQYLYEQKIVSYPRTDSSHITTEELDKYYEGLLSLSNIEGLDDIPLPDQKQKDAFAKNKQYVDNSKVKGHSALTVLPGASIQYDKLTTAQQQVLYLIGRSMLLSFMDPVVKDKTDILTESNDLLFKTTGSVVSEAGWSQYVPEYGAKSNMLPEVSEGDSVAVDHSELKEGKTTPPNRYTVKSLMSVLENIHRLVENDEEKAAIKEAEGLGRPSTRTSILNEMVKNEYIYTKGNKGNYYVTPFGVSLIESIGHTQLASPELSAHYETLLQHIEGGQSKAEDVYQQIIQYTQSMVEELLTIPLSLKGAPTKERQVVYEGEDGYIVYASKKGYYDEAFQKWMQGDRSGKPEGLWVPKKMQNDSMKVKGTITDKDMVDMLTGKEVTKKVSYHQKEAVDRQFSITNGKLVIENKNKAQDVQVEDLTIEDTDLKYVTGIKNDRPFAFYKLATGQTIFDPSFGYHLTHEDLALLIKGESITRPLISKKGKEYLGILTLGDKQLDLSFPEKEVVYAFDKPGLQAELIEGDNKKGHYAFYKVNNEFTVPKEVAGVTITESILETLAAGEPYTSSDWVNKKGNTFRASLIIKNGKSVFDFNNDYLIDEEGLKVILIEGENKNGPYSFYKVNDEFTIGTIFAGRPITEDDLRTLAQTGRLFAPDWVSNKGRLFSANLIVDGDRVRFDF